MTDEAEDPATPPKVNWVGAPAIFVLDSLCSQLNEAFGDYGCYLVGSAITRRDWRDVDVRLIMEDAEFDKLFPHAGENWELDQRWLTINTAIAEQLSRQTGLPVDFQIHRMTEANRRNPSGERQPLGIRIRRRNNE